MSFLANADLYDAKFKNLTLGPIVSQFSGLILIDYQGNIQSELSYNPDNQTVKFSVVENTISGPTLINVTRKAWALPGYMETQVIRANDTVQELEIGSVVTKPNNLMLITSIPLYWFPSVPNLNNYELRFDVPIIDLKTNTQYYKVQQQNIIEEGVVIIQLSTRPLQERKLTERERRLNG